jgi:hypothetical protein
MKFTDGDYRLTVLLSDLMTENSPSRKPTSPAMMESWADTVRLMREQDGRSPEDIEFVLRWSQRDDFWKTNILSMGKLRKQFDALVIRMSTSRGRANEVQEKRNQIFTGS